MVYIEPMVKFKAYLYPMVFKFISFFTCLILTAFSVYARQIPLSDSVPMLIAIERKIPNAQIDTLNSRSKYLSYSDTDSTLIYAATAYRHAVKNNYQRGETDALIQIGKAYYIKGNYTESLQTAQKAHELSIKAGYRYGEAASLNSIGLIYLAQNQLNQAIVEFKRSLAVSQKNNDKRLQAMANFNIGLCYDEKFDSDVAIPYLLEAIAISKTIDYKQIEAMALNRLGETYFRKKDYQRSIYSYRQVLNNKNYQNDWENSFAYSGLAQVYLAQRNYPVSIVNAQKGLDYAMLVKAKWDIERCLKLLYTAYAAQGDYKNAFKYLEKDKLYSDSLLNEAKENEINALHLKQKQKENEELFNKYAFNLTQLKMTNRVATVVAILAVLLLISKILIYYFYRQKSLLNKSLIKTSADISLQNDLITVQKRELEQINQTKDQLFTIIGHDLRGPFASILQAMNVMKSGDISQSDMKDFLDNFHERITVTALMLDNLVLWAETQRSGAATLPQNVILQRSADQTLTIFDYLIREKNITVTHHHPDDLNIYADPDQVRVIIQNLIGNAIKFTPAGGKITVFYTEDEERITFHVRDTGVGIPESKLNKIFNVTGKNISSYGTNQEKGIGIGLVLVKEFAEKNGALIQVKSREGEGTEFSVSFKRGVGN